MLFHRTKMIKFNLKKNLYKNHLQFFNLLSNDIISNFKL